MAEAGKELVPVPRPPEDEWRDIIFQVLPDRMGKHPATFMEEAHELSSRLANPPVSSVSRALINLWQAGELHMTPNFVARMPETKRQAG